LFCLLFFCFCFFVFFQPESFSLSVFCSHSFFVASQNDISSKSLTPFWMEGSRVQLPSSQPKPAVLSQAASFCFLCLLVDPKWPSRENAC
jgi:hypothetical protein